MIEFAKKLDSDGFTYQLPSGLYFDTARDPHYGELAQMSTEGQLEAARLEHVEGRAARPTSRCGARRSPASAGCCAGNPRGAGAPRAGTWSAR